LQYFRYLLKSFYPLIACLPLFLINFLLKLLRIFNLVAIGQFSVNYLINDHWLNLSFILSLHFRLFLSLGRLILFWIVYGFNYCFKWDRFQQSTLLRISRINHRLQNHSYFIFGFPIYFRFCFNCFFLQPRSPFI